MKRVYMYSLYERIWHWLQAALMLGLIVTGVEIHWPELGLMGFASAVNAHGVLAFVLLANAALSLFYHLSTGEIRQFMPEPREFSSLMVKQARYYLGGIFRGEPHPIAKNPERKLNPLQQLTYLGMLNVLLPLQVVTGLVMWGAQRWPGLLDAVGGLAVPAKIHTLGAWLFAAFLVIHVYMTTTGSKPFTLIKAMVTGWEEEEA
jgi:Ni/Fe-hydrogenase b-type cytochrome subunit